MRYNPRVTRFHDFHGENIELTEDNTVAYRSKSFANAVTFSEKPINPGEIFLVEIEETEAGWSGHMRIGFTQVDPVTVQIPPYALPDLSDMGKTWIYGITKTDIPARERYERVVPSPLKIENNILKTNRGSFPLELLRPTCRFRNVLPTERGSKIGITYIPISASEASIYFIMNGTPQDICQKLSYKEAPLFVVVDIYGSTKRVRIVQLHIVPTLQGLCRDAILSRVPDRSISSLPLPSLLKNYLCYRL